jgi:hypothetical protein
MVTQPRPFREGQLLEESGVAALPPASTHQRKAGSAERRRPFCQRSGRRIGAAGACCRELFRLTFTVSRRAGRWVGSNDRPGVKTRMEEYSR